MITTEQAKAHLNITTDSDDQLLSGMIQAAQKHVEAYCGIKVADDYPDGAPADMQQATLMLCGHLYENREQGLIGVSFQSVEPGVYELLAPHRKWEF